MNMNEVLANRASELLGGERAWRGGCIPTTTSIWAVVQRRFSHGDVRGGGGSLKETLLPALQALGATLAAKAVEFSDVVKIGRTHLQDATPLTVGQEMSGWVAQLDYAERAIVATLPALSDLAVGGTAVGTGSMRRRASASGWRRSWPGAAVSPAAPPTSLRPWRPTTRWWAPTVRSKPATGADEDRQRCALAGL